jgi:hypothetical protein
LIALKGQSVEDFLRVTNVTVKPLHRETLVVVFCDPQKAFNALSASARWNDDGLTTLRNNKKTQIFSCFLSLFSRKETYSYFLLIE